MGETKPCEICEGPALFLVRRAKGWEPLCARDLEWLMENSTRKFEIVRIGTEEQFYAELSHTPRKPKPERGRKKLDPEVRRQRIAESNRRHCQKYYWEHVEEMRARARAYYYANREECTRRAQLRRAAAPTVRQEDTLADTRGSFALLRPSLPRL